MSITGALGNTPPLMHIKSIRIVSLHVFSLIYI